MLKKKPTKNPKPHKKPKCKKGKVQPTNNTETWKEGKGNNEGLHMSKINIKKLPQATRQRKFPLGYE